MNQTSFAELEQRLARVEDELETLRDFVHPAHPRPDRDLLHEAPPALPPSPEVEGTAPNGHPSNGGGASNGGSPPNGTGDSPAAADGTGAPTTDPIVKWFQARGITVDVEEEVDADRVFDRLAEYLGDHYSDLQRLVGGIRWTIRENDETAFPLQRMGDSQKEHFLEFARMLNDLAFFAEYHHNEKAERLKLKGRKDPRLLRFISGQWLERYVLVKGRKCFEGASIDFASARNIEIRPNGSIPHFEMDVLFLIDGEPIWIECKSREFRRDIGKYAERAELLGIPLNRTVVAVQYFEDERTKEAAADIPRLYGLSVNDTDGLAKRFEEIAAEAHRSPAGAAAEDDPATLASKLGSYLTQSQLAPHPEARDELLAALLEAVREGLPATAGELRERMRARVPEVLEPAAHPVLVAVRRGGGLLGEGGGPCRETSLATEVFGLAADDVAGLDALCLSAYREAVEKKMPQVASRPDFEALLGRVAG